jgi:hypothetical protein
MHEDELSCIMADSASRRDLVKALFSENYGESWGVKIRFVAACDQYLGHENQGERTRMGDTLAQLFFTKDGMFKIDSVSPSVARAVKQGKQNALSKARDEVMQELLLSPEVSKVVNRMS